MPDMTSISTARVRSHARRLASAALGAAVAAAIAAAPAMSAGSPFPPEHKCKPRGYSAYEFVYSVKGTPPHAVVRARLAQVICGGPDDSHWYPVGPMRTVRLSPKVSVQLDPHGSTTPRRATFADFAKLVKVRSKDKQFVWWGAGFGVHINAARQITSLTELFHP